MNSSKLPTLPPVTKGYHVNPKRPILTYSATLDRPTYSAPHRHPRAQLVYAHRGVMHVASANHRWIVPPSQGIWVPCNVEHQVTFPGPVWLSNLFLDPSVIRGMPETCTVLLIDPLLRELIAKAMVIGDDYGPRTAQWRLMSVLIDELREARSSPLRISTAKDERVLRVMDHLFKSPGDKRPLSRWARVATTSGRTLARLFVTETGMTFGDWRRQVRLLHAVEQLANDHSVTDVAFSLGYESVSGFVAAFRRALGDSPRRYVMSRKESEGPEEIR